MVLCISGIQYPTQPDSDNRVSRAVDEDGETVEKPVLEVTDGWYRVRAEVDDAIARAIRRGALRVGMKIGVVGAKVCRAHLLVRIWLNTVRHQLADRRADAFGGRVAMPREVFFKLARIAQKCVVII